MIYQYEWSADVTKLTPSGQGHVAQIAPDVVSGALSGRDRALSPTVVLDESRRMAVLEALASCGNPVTPDRVILGRPEAEGMYGQEAPGIAGRMFSNQTGGQGAGAGTLGGGATSGGTQGGVALGALGSAAVLAVELGFY